MLELNVDFSLLNRYFGISISQIKNEYVNKDFEEIMALEAQKGNEKARNYEEILSNPEKIKEIFVLASNENKLQILSNMSEGDVDDLLPYLTSKQLSLGLGFFTREKIIAMTKELPIENLCELIFNNFSKKEVLSLMEATSMKIFLSNPEVERKYIQEYFKTLDPQSLKALMRQTQNTNENDNKSKLEILKDIENLNEKDFNRFINSMDRNNLTDLIIGVTNQEDKLLQLFNPNDLVNPMNTILKGEQIEILQQLDPEFLVPMIQELPVDLTQITLTQIDTNEFAKILTEDFQNVLKSVVLFAQN